VPVCRVSAFGIDSNIFASNYQAPKPWSHGDHIAVAMVWLIFIAYVSQWQLAVSCALATDWAKDLCFEFDWLPTSLTGAR
jgi:hypothetical protein